MSEAQTTADTAFWMEGFLSGNSMQLLYQPLLWEMLNAWLSELPDEHFRTVLPVLRRTFAGNSAAERKKILDAARIGLPLQQTSVDQQTLHTTREALIGTAIARIMGWIASDKIG